MRIFYVNRFSFIPTSCAYDKPPKGQNISKKKRGFSLQTVELAIIGAGASGLAAALAASEILKTSRKRILLLEGNSKAGKKLLATGNGRCNLSNGFIPSDVYHGTGCDSTWMEQMLSAYPPARIQNLFAKIGLLTRSDTQQRLYPLNNQAAAVLYHLVLACQKNHVDFVLDCNIFSITKQNGYFLIKPEEGKCFLAKKCILATGSEASPKHSCSTVNGYAMAAQLGHTVLPRIPMLTAIRCNDSLLKSLKGVRCKAKICLFLENKEIYAEIGEIIFSENTISGICIFNCSAFLADALQNGKDISSCCAIHVDFTEGGDLPLFPFFQAMQANHPTYLCQDLLSGIVHMKLGTPLIRKARIDPLTPISALTTKQLVRLVKLITCYVFIPQALEPFDKAQSVNGGIPLAEADPNTMESRKQRGLYLCGELLDAHGRCGGYNLHFAWATGHQAGTSAALSIIKAKDTHI